MSDKLRALYTFKGEFEYDNKIIVTKFQTTHTYRNFPRSFKEKPPCDSLAWESLNTFRDRNGYVRRQENKREFLPMALMLKCTLVHSEWIDLYLNNEI